MTRTRLRHKRHQQPARDCPSWSADMTRAAHLSGGCPQAGCPGFHIEHRDPRSGEFRSPSRTGTSLPPTVRRGPLSASSLDMVREEQARSHRLRPIGTQRSPQRLAGQPRMHSSGASATTQNAFFWCKRDICIRGPDRIPPSERTKWRRPISVSACTDTAEFGHMVICR